MAASPALRDSPPVRSSSAITGDAPHPQARGQSQVVRTPLHLMQTGAGARSIRRRITPGEGFALQVLGHAIEYLADEYVSEAGSLSSMIGDDPRVEAMQVLMAANREVYFGCKVMPSLGERIWGALMRWAR